MSNRVSRTVTDEELNAIMYVESAGKPTAKARTSTASGLFQFLKGTWRDTVKKHRKDVFAAFPNGELLRLRFNPSFAIEMGARFTEDNRRIVGERSTLGDLYLAHFLGAGDAKKVYRNPPNTPMAELVDEKVIQANESIIRGKTAGQVRNWAQQKMNAAMRKAEDYVGRYYKGPFEIEHGPVAKEDTTSDPVKKKEFDPSRPGLKEGADARLYDNQLQLKSMNYSPGRIDGVWGGGTAGAIAGFFNDYAPEFSVPTKWQEYDKNYDGIDEVIDKAEREGFRRPVTKKRAEADAETVEEVAPEIVPAKRTLWGGVTAFFSAFGTAVYQFFAWLMDWKDDAESWGITDLLHKVPTFVWLLLGSALIGFLVYTALRTIRGIEKPVQTGERL